MQPLTQRQSEVKEFIRKFISSNGYAPTPQEVADAFGLAAHSAAEKLLNRMESRGHIRRSRTAGGRAIKRAMVLVD